jgi:hypothetical protein
VETLEKDLDPVVDLSDSKAIEKFVYLKEIGFLDFIKEKYPMMSHSRIASLVTGITGEKYITVQPAINSILQDHETSKSYPGKKTIETIRLKLIELGFQLKD